MFLWYYFKFSHEPFTFLFQLTCQPLAMWKWSWLRKNKSSHVLKKRSKLRKFPRRSLLVKNLKLVNKSQPFIYKLHLCLGFFFPFNELERLSKSPLIPILIASVQYSWLRFFIIDDMCQRRTVCKGGACLTSLLSYQTKLTFWVFIVQIFWPTFRIFWHFVFCYAKRVFSDNMPNRSYPSYLYLNGYSHWEFHFGRLLKSL